MRRLPVAALVAAALLAIAPATRAAAPSTVAARSVAPRTLTEAEMSATTGAGFWRWLGDHIEISWVTHLVDFDVDGSPSSYDCGGGCTLSQIFGARG